MATGLWQRDCRQQQIRTDEVEAWLKRALDVVRWLHAVSALSDGCCRLVCEMLDVPTLVSLMEVSKADDL